MRFLKTVICIGLISALTGAGSLQAQLPFLSGPTLGFTPDEAGTAIRPIMGIPGASILVDRLELGANIRDVVISPKQDYALAARTEDAQIVAIDLRSNPPAMVAIHGAHQGADVMAISPNGSVAAIYDPETRIIQVIAHLPSAPELVREFDSSRIAGSVTGIAVSDDGSIVLARFTDGDGSLWAMDASGASWPVPAGRPSAIAFFPNSSNAVVADDATQSAFLLIDVGHAASQIPLLSAEDGMTAFSAVSVSEDGRRVFLADAESGNIAVVDMETRRPALLSCQCRPTGLYSLKGTSVFRLTETSREPMMVLDASKAEPRFVIVPPTPSGSMEAQ